jgi:hypothetical protein
MGWTDCSLSDVPREVLGEAPPPPRKRSRASRKLAYCHALTRWGNHADAAAAAGITDRTARRWREDDAAFGTRCRIALEMWRDDVWLAAQARVETPEVKPVWHRGRQIGHIKRFNTTLLMRLLDRLPRRRG